MTVRITQEKLWLSIFRLFALAMIILAIIGAVKSYSSVPFWDMWNGYLEFYTNVVYKGDIQAWWQQHNEHRIVLARTLFWLDLSFFSGSGKFLIVINFLLIFCSYVVFNKILQERLGIEEGESEYPSKIFNLLIFVILFSWIQEANITWAFQSQFFLAQLLPLIAFFLLYKSFVCKKASNSLFVLACVIGVVSIGSMANGILALPLMFIYALVIRMTKLRIFILCLLSIITITLYFYGYDAVVGHGSLKDALLNNRIGLLQYISLYIGGPFYYMTKNIIVAQIAGLFLISSSAYFAWIALKKPSKSSLQLALLFFILYIGGTALGTGGGRLFFGIEQALSGRYQTPALMAWVALLILYSPKIIKKINNNSLLALSMLILIPILLLPQQLKALSSKQGLLFEREIAALAIELRIKDQSQISNVFPSAEWVLSASEVAVENNLSIFGQPKIKDIPLLIGKKETDTKVKCVGSLDGVTLIPGVLNYLKVRGWMYQADAQLSPKSVHIIKNGEIIGYALTGQPRDDVANAINLNAKTSGFKGYILADKLGGGVVLKGLQPECQLDVFTAAPSPL